MARRLQVSTICLVILLLVVPLVYSKDDENKGMNDVGELLQKLLKAEKERRTMSDDTNADGSGAPDQGITDGHDEGVDVSIQKGLNGVVKQDITDNGEEFEKITQDCKSRYELIMMKGDEKGEGGVCYLHKMDDKLYEKNCNGNGTGGKIDVKYNVGPQIEDNILLSKMEGAAGCVGRPTYELIVASVKRGEPDEYEKKLAERRGCSYCNLYSSVCTTVCCREEGWWWGRYCASHCLDCVSGCRYECR